MANNIISMALWGEDPLYLEGAMANIRLAGEIYPDWRLRLHCDWRTRAILKLDLEQLEKQGVDLVDRDRHDHPYPIFWRLAPMEDELVDHVIFRDADSRFNVRERAAVDAWLESGLAAHVMRDHMHHAGFPMMGGMWGVRPAYVHGVLYTMHEDWWRAPKPVDSRILSTMVYPHIQGCCLEHVRDGIPNKFHGEQFPPHENYDGFVGEIIQPKVQTQKEQVAYAAV